MPTFARGADNLPGVLVGRAKEIRELRRHLKDGRAVVVVGEAGIGKTALLRGALREEGIQAMEGGGLQMLPSVSYLPLSRALGSVPPEGDTASVAQHVLESLDGAALLLDDLHWSDSETLAVAKMLAGACPLLTAVRRGDPGAERALATLRDAGATEIELGPLGDSAARELLETLDPALHSKTVERVMRQARGNPLLLGQLRAESSSGSALELSFLSRLHPHTEAAKRAAARAALLRRPASRRLLGEGAEELLEAGLLVADGSELSLPHDLMASAIEDGLDPARRRQIHIELAHELKPGEAARHHLAAGDTDSASACALEAAGAAARPAERASYLAIAATWAKGAGADPLRLQAAMELNAIGDNAAAAEILEKVEGQSPATRAELALEAGISLEALGRADDAATQFSEGAALARGSGSELEVRLALVEAKRLQRVGWGSATAVETSRRACELAKEAGACRAEAEYVLATAEYVSGDIEQSLERACRAERLARGSGERSVELEAGLLVGAALTALGLGKEAHDHQTELAALARSERMDGWEARIEAMLALLEINLLGDYQAGTERAHRLLESGLSLLGGQTEDLRYAHASALAMTGSISMARSELLAAIDTAYSDTARSLLLSGIAETEWLARRPRQAASAARDALEVETDSPNRQLAEVTLAWTQLEAGGEPRATAPETGFGLIDDGVRLETEAIVLLATEDAKNAANLFREAASNWRRFEIYRELRASWAYGEALCRSEAIEAGTKELLALERRTEELNAMSMLARVRGSLRAVGVRRAEERGAVGVLTAREHEVMRLVAKGLASSDVAAQLGIARSTVETLIGSAMTKLGAKNRRHAALMAASAEAS